MADIKWIKVAVDMFEDTKIDFIRSLPEGDAIIVTWIQMLAIAGKSNMGGYLMVAEGIPYTEQLLSDRLRRSPTVLQFALETLKKLKMIDIEDGPYHITKWEKHQNVEGMEKVRLQTNERVKRHREKGKNKIETLPCNANVTLQVTHGNATELEVELDIEKDKDITTTAGDEFKKVFDSFCQIHGKAEHQAFSQITDIQKLIDKGISSEIIISVMREKHGDKARRGESVHSFTYYQSAIIEKWEGGKKLEEYGGNTKGIRLGSNQTQSSRSEGESKVFRGKWDDTVIPMPKMSG